MTDVFLGKSADLLLSFILFSEHSSQAENSFGVLRFEKNLEFYSLRVTLIHISKPTRLRRMSYDVYCL